MKARLHIENESHMAEWPDNGPGMMQAKAFRRNHPQFKRRKIRRVIQAFPERIPCGQIIALT